MSRWILTRDGQTILDVTTPDTAPTLPTEPAPPPPSIPVGTGDITGGAYTVFAAAFPGDEREFAFNALNPRGLVATGSASGGVGSLSEAVVSVVDAAGNEVLPPTPGANGMFGAWLSFVPGATYRIRVKLTTGGAVTVQVQ